MPGAFELALLTHQADVSAFRAVYCYRRYRVGQLVVDHAGWFIEARTFRHRHTRITHTHAPGYCNRLRPKDHNLAF